MQNDPTIVTYLRKVVTQVRTIHFVLVVMRDIRWRPHN